MVLFFLLTFLNFELFFPILTQGAFLSTLNNEEDREYRRTECMLDPQPKKIMYLRIGKAGSSGLFSWMHRSKFQTPLLLFRSASDDAETVLSLNEELGLIKRLNQRKIMKLKGGLYQPDGDRPWIFGGQHTYFINFTRHSFEQPSVFTMLRKPAERYLSQYEYWRTLKDKFGYKIQEEGSSIEDCALPENQQTIPFGCPEPNYQTSYLCGHGPPCVQPPNEATFLQAQQHLKLLDVVGVVEKMVGMEALLVSRYPHFFRSTLQNITANKTRKRGNKLRDLISSETRDQINNNHFYDNFLYDMALEKMNLLFAKCQLNFEEIEEQSRRERKGSILKTSRESMQQSKAKQRKNKQKRNRFKS